MLREIKNIMIAFEKSVGAVIFRKEKGRALFLLLNYGKLKSGKYHWGFAKGHVEKGESEEETMRREILEETGISKLKKVSNFQESNRYFYKAFGEELKKRKARGKKTLIAKKVIYFLAEVKSKEVKISEEHVDYKWLPYDKAVEKVTYKNLKKVLEKAKTFLDKSFFC